MRAQSFLGVLTMAADADAKKRRAALAALELISSDTIIGVGTGSTVNFLIEGLATRPGVVRAAVSSSEGSSARLRSAGVALADLNDVVELDLYIDGADEATPERYLIKGGGGALTREKIVASASRRFACIIDDSKMVTALGRFPLPVEVIPMARALVARTLTAYGGRPVWREGFVTDNCNHILDVHGLVISDPLALERELNQIPGVVTVGLFAIRPADVLVIGTARGVETR